MVKPWTLLLLGLLVTTVSGCVSAPSASTASADANGTWIGSTPTGGHRVTLHLQQTGTNVTGTLAGAGALDGPIQGTAAGNAIQLAPRSGSTEAPRLVIRGDLMNGQLGGVPVTFVRMR
jgi:hypothetical protein